MELESKTFLCIEKMAQKQIIRIDDHINLLSTYCQIHSINFPLEKEKNYHQIKEEHFDQNHEYNHQLQKYYDMRYFLFSKYDEGIQLDDESWYSVIPESVSLHLKNRLKKIQLKNIFEPFCGAGGIAVHLYEQFESYVVNDILKSRIDLLLQNMSVYGKHPSKMEIKCENFLEMKSFKTDALIICPPWGGIDTRKYSYSQFDDIMKPKLTEIMKSAIKFSRNIMLQMPKTTNISNILKIIANCQLFPAFTIEQIKVNNRVSQLFIYFGNAQFTNINNNQLYKVLYTEINGQTKNQRVQIKKEMHQNPRKFMKNLYKQTHQKQ